jgi:flagellar biosynthetic protein FliO
LIADATPATATAATAASAAPTATATAAPTQAIVPPSGSILDTGLGGLDLIDVATKCTIVLVLLFITLRVLGRMQSAGGPKRGGRLEVLESRPLAPKASLHLVAVGDRRLVVGLTPGGMVSLAELKADELESPSFASELAAQEAAVRPNNGSIQTGSPLSPGSPLSAVVAPIDAFAGRLASILGGGRAR